MFPLPYCAAARSSLWGAKIKLIHCLLTTPAFVRQLHTYPHKIKNSHHCGPGLALSGASRTLFSCDISLRWWDWYQQIQKEQIQLSEVLSMIDRSTIASALGIGRSGQWGWSWCSQPWVALPEMMIFISTFSLLETSPGEPQWDSWATNCIWYIMKL